MKALAFNWSQLKGSLIIVALGFSFSACTAKNSRQGIDPAPERKASIVVSDSFLVQKIAPKADLGVDKAHVVIAKAALEKEFLLSSNVMTQLPLPMFQSLRSRVVYFILKNEHVYMMESVGGKSVGQGNTKQFLPIAQFDILHQTEKNITIDFNAGMTSIIAIGDMYSSDDGAPAPEGTPVTSVNVSYLENVSVENNQLFIQQVAQVMKEDQLISFEVRYYLAPYNPDPSFEPTLTPDFSKVGYFQANPLVDSYGNSFTYAMKWNTKKPIQFALSANTPEQYKETVRNGVLYWNRIIGDDKIQVVELTDKSITAPNPNYNIIQWADWDAAGFAYADAHVDPRSGEVTHAQVFFPSAFISAAMEKRVRTISGAETIPSVKVGLVGFKTAQLCHRDILKPFAQSIANQSGQNGITKEAMQKAIKDYVFEVIAHEVGHVLGLRHNFAGNLVANYDMADRVPMALSYYKNMKAPEGVIDSSSVMEYSRFEESSWNGDRLQHGAPALSHDQVTMDFLYNNIAVPANSPPFCTDSGIAKYADCSMSDASRSTVSYADGNYQFNLQIVPVKILNQYISETKVPDAPGKPLKSVAQVLLNPPTLAHSISLDRYKLLSLLKDETRLIQVRSKLFPIWPAANDAAILAEKNFIADEIHRLGGLDKMIDLKESTIDQFWIQKFETLLNDPNFNQVTIGDKTYSFTDEEKESMKAQFKLFAGKLKSELIKDTLTALSGKNVSFEATYGQAALETTKGWFEHSVTDELAQMTTKISDHYLFSKEETKSNYTLFQQDGAQKPIELPIYKYDQDIRTAAASVWVAPHVALEWAYFEKLKTAADFKTEMNILGDADKIDFAKTDKQVLKWYLQNQAIQKNLN